MTVRVLMAHPQTELYGADRMFLEAVGALLATDAEVTVTLPGWGSLAEELTRVGATIELIPTPVVRKAAMTPSGFLSLFGLALTSAPRAWKMLRLLKPDVVYVSTVTAPLWVVLARLAGSRVVVHVHEAQPSAPSVVRWLLMAPLTAAHSIIVNSVATGSVTTQHFRRLASRTVLIYNGLPVPQLQRPAGQPAHRPLRLVAVGRLSVIKGTDLAVEAAIELAGRGREVNLLLVGSVFAGYEWFENQLRSRVTELELEHVIEFAGFKKDGWTAFATCDIALVASRNEPFGNTAVEAQLCGAPIIVTDRQGLPETVDHGRRGTIVQGEDAIALADAVEHLADNWDVTMRMSELARTECIELFSLDRYRREIQDVVLER